MAINIPANINLKVSGSRPLGKLSGDLNQFESSLRAANARVLAFGASTAIIAGLTKSFKDLASSTIQVQKSFIDINRILSATDSNFNKFGADIFRIAKQTATGFDDVAKAALEFSRQGLSVEEVSKRTADALTLVRLTGIGAEKSVSLLTATVNAFNNLDTTKAVSKFVAVETQFAVAASDLVEGLSRVGSAATDAKVSFDELNALVTAVQQTTGRGGAVIGNALKTIFTRLQRQSTLEQLERFNIGVRDIEGNILPAVRILDNFAKSYDGLSDSTQAYLREQVAGVFQANNLSAILRDLSKDQSTFGQALNVSKNATDEAAQANEKLNRSLSALLTQSSTEITQLQSNIGKITFEPLATSITKAFVDSLEEINKLISTPTKELETGGEQFGSTLGKGILKGLSNLVLPAAVGIFSVLAVVAKRFLGDVRSALPAYIGLETEAAKRLALEKQIQQTLENQLSITQRQATSKKGTAFTIPAAGIMASDMSAASAAEIASQRATQEIQKRISLGGAGSDAGMVSAFGNIAGSRVGGSMKMDDSQIGNFRSAANNLSAQFAATGGKVADFGVKVNTIAKKFGVNAIKLNSEIRKAAQVDLSGAISTSNKKFKSVSSKAQTLAGKISLGEMSAQQGAYEMREFALNANLSAQQAGKLANTMMQVNQGANQAKSAMSRMGSFMAGGLGQALTVGLPIVAGIADQSYFGDKQRTELGPNERIFKGALSNASTYGTSGAMIGGAIGLGIGGIPGAMAGAAIGTVAGTIAGLGAAVMNANLSLDELAQVTDEYASKTKEEGGLANQYIEAVRKLNDPALRGEARVEAQKKFQELLEKVSKSDLPERFKSAGRNVTELAASLKFYEKERRRGEVIRGLGTKGAKLELENAPVKTYPSTKPPIGSTFMDYSPAFKTRKGSFSEKAFEAIVPAFGEFFGYFADETGKISEETAQKINKIVKNNSPANELFGFDEFGLAGELQSAFPDAFGLGDIDMLSQQFKKFENKELIELFEQASRIVEEYNVLLYGEAPQTEALQRSLIKTKQRLTSITREKGAASFDQKIRDSYNEVLSSIQEQISADLQLTSEQLVRNRYSNQVSQLSQKRSQAEASFSLKNISGLLGAFDQAKFTQSDPALQSYGSAMTDFILNPDQALADLREDLSKGIFTGEDITKLENFVADLSETRRQELENLNYEETVLKARHEVELQRAKNNDRLATLTFEEKSGQFNLRKSQLEQARPLQRELSILASEKSLVSSSRTLGETEKFRETQRLNKEMFEKQKQIDKANQDFQLGMFEAEKSYQSQRLQVELSMANAQIEAQKILIQALSDLAEVIANPAAIIEQAKMKALADSDEKFKSAFKDLNQSTFSEATVGSETNDDKRTALKKARRQEQKLINARYSELQETTGFSSSKNNSSGAASGFESISIDISEASLEMQRLNTLTEQERKLLVQTFGEDGTDALQKFVITAKQAEDAFYQVRGEGSLTRGLKSGFKTIRDDVDTFRFELGDRVPALFADNMTNALNQAMDGAESLGDALRGAATGFLTEIRNQLTANSVKGLMSAFSGNTINVSGSTKQKGGFIHAQNGMYISGTRTGDRNPAMLEDGEYVLNRNAVKSLGGPASIDQLNFGMAPRFQSGGSAFINEKVGSSRLSGLFYASDSPELQEARDAAKARDQKREAKKAQRKQLKNALISTLVMGAFSGASGYISNKGGLGGMFKKNGNSVDERDSLYDPYSMDMDQSGGYIGRGLRNADSIPAFMSGGEFVMNNKAVRKYGLGLMNRLNGGYIPAYQSGGSVAESPASTLGSMGGANTNNISININMGQSGGGSSEGGSTSSLGNRQDGGDQSSNAQEFSKRIESAVVKVIQKEQRVGGLLTEGGRKNN